MLGSDESDALLNITVQFDPRSNQQNFDVTVQFVQ